jgi:peptide/nickel transport system permease protein
VIANTLLNVAFTLVTLSSLSFLGIGSAPGSPEWGRMVSENLDLMPSNVWSLVGPGLAIIITAVAANLTGDYLQEKLAARGRS